MSAAPTGSPRRLGVARAIIERSILEGDVEVVDGRISAVGLSPAGTGLAVPGLLDIQVNGYGGVDVADASQEGLATLGRSLAADGVLWYCPTVITAPPDDMRRALDAIAMAKGRVPPDGARIAGAHVEGPFLSPARAGVHPRAGLRLPDIALAEDFLESGIVSIFSLAPELPGALGLIEHLVGRGIVVSAAHSDASVEQADLAFAAGVRATTHTWNGMRPLLHRDPGLIGAALRHPAVSIGLIGDGVHVAPEVLHLTWAAATGRICLVTDAVEAAGAPDGRYHIGSVVIERRGGRVFDLDGRVGGGTTPLLEAVRLAIASGVAPVHAFAAASSVPAALLGLEDIGILRVEGPADLLVLDDDLVLQRVLLGGQVLAGAH